MTGSFFTRNCFRGNFVVDKDEPQLRFLQDGIDFWYMNISNGKNMVWYFSCGVDTGWNSCIFFSRTKDRCPPPSYPASKGSFSEGLRVTLAQLPTIITMDNYVFDRRPSQFQLFIEVYHIFSIITAWPPGSVITPLWRRLTRIPLSCGSFKKDLLHNWVRFTCVSNFVWTSRWDFSGLHLK